MNTYKSQIRIEPAEAFFKRGRKMARMADRGDAIPPSRVVAFDDIESLLQVLSAKRALVVTRAIQALERPQL
jgi:predicted transcriptional regulator